MADILNKTITNTGIWIPAKPKVKFRIWRIQIQTASSRWTHVFFGSDRTDDDILYIWNYYIDATITRSFEIVDLESARKYPEFFTGGENQSLTCDMEQSTSLRGYVRYEEISA